MAPRCLMKASIGEVGQLLAWREAHRLVGEEAHRHGDGDALLQKMLVDGHRDEERPPVLGDDGQMAGSA